MVIETGRRMKQPDSQQKDYTKAPYAVLGIIVVVSVIVLFSVIAVKMRRGTPGGKVSQSTASPSSEIMQQKNSTPSAVSSSFSPTPSPVVLPQGRIAFTINSGSTDSGPSFQSGFIDPYDPKIGDPQIIHIRLVSKNAVSKASIFMKTDAGTNDYSMKKIAGTESDGEWEASWSVSDTHATFYQAKIIASDGSGEGSVVISLRP